MNPHEIHNDQELCQVTYRYERHDLVNDDDDEGNGGCDDDTTNAAAIYTMLEINQTADVTRGTIPH